MAKKHKNLITGLDIGTAKVMAVTCEVQPDGQLRLVGLGTAASKGIKRGRVAADHLHRTALITAYRPREHCASSDQSQDLASGNNTLSC